MKGGEKECGGELGRARIASLKQGTRPMRIEVCNRGCQGETWA
jgi:hypothetical protein